MTSKSREVFFVLERDQTKKKKEKTDYTQIKKDVADGVKKKPGETKLAEDIPGRGKFYCTTCRFHLVSSDIPFSRLKFFSCPQTVDISSMQRL